MDSEERVGAVAMAPTSPRRGWRRVGPCTSRACSSSPRSRGPREPTAHPQADGGIQATRPRPGVARGPDDHDHIVAKSPVVRRASAIAPDGRWRAPWSPNAFSRHVRTAGFAPGGGRPRLPPVAWPRRYKEASDSTGYEQDERHQPVCGTSAPKSARAASASSQPTPMPGPRQPSTAARQTPTTSGVAATQDRCR